MRGRLYYKFKRKLLVKTAKKNWRLILLGLLLLSVVSIQSSAKYISILGRYRVAHKGQVTATAYNSLANQTDSTPWITANGTRCREGIIASNFLPLGTKVYIEGIKGIGGMKDGIYVVEDRMNRRYRKRIDI